jgi:hypothetical protein
MAGASSPNSKILKPIRLSGHARSQLPFRGATQDEIKDTIRSAPWSPAELGRLECRKNFNHGKE